MTRSNSIARPATIISSTKGQLEMYFRKPLIGRGQWRWRIRALNYKIVAQGSEGYTNFNDMLAALDTTRDTLLLTLGEFDGQ